MVFSPPLAGGAGRISGELSVSLRTGDYRCALYRARVLRLGLETLLTRLTPSTSKAETEAIVWQWIDACVWRQETRLSIDMTLPQPDRKGAG